MCTGSVRGGKTQTTNEPMQLGPVHVVTRFFTWIYFHVFSGTVRTMDLQILSTSCAMAPFYKLKNSGHHTQQPQQQRYSFLPVHAVVSWTYVYVGPWYFLVSTQWYGCQCRGFLTCTHILMSCNCTQGLYGHRKSLHWKFTLGEKSLAAPGT